MLSRLIFIGLTIQIISCTNPATQSDLIKNPSLCAAGTKARVTKVIDGDTIDVKLKNGDSERIRYIGIDTPEFEERCFNEATRRNKALLKDPNIRLIRDTNNRDRYGRLVRYVCNSDDVFIDAQLIIEGYATAFHFWPDVRFAEYFSSLEKTAIKNQTGCLNN